MALTKIQNMTSWALTLPIVAMMLMSAVAYFTVSPQVVEGLTHLGYPLYFLTILGTAKVLGSAALVFRKFKTLTEWAYAGFTFTFLGASYSHFAAGDGFAKAIVPLVFLALLAGSYHFWKKNNIL